MELKLDVDLGGALAALDLLEADVHERAAVSAVNKTIAKGNTRMARAISRRYNVSVSYVRSRLKVTRAKFSAGSADVSAVLSGSGARGTKRSANLIAFVQAMVSFAQAKRQRAAGEGGTYVLRNGVVRTKALELQFRIKRGGKTVTIPGAFIANKGRTVFIREGKPRLPIKALQTIDVPQMFNERESNSEVIQVLQEEFPGIFDREVRYYVDRFNRTGR